MEKLMLKDISTTNRKSIVSMDCLEVVGTAVKEFDGTILVNGFGGIRTQSFTTNSSDVIVSMKCSTKRALTLRIGYVTAQGKSIPGGVREVTAMPKDKKCVDFYVRFDAAYFIIYCNAVSFWVQVDCEKENLFKIEAGLVWEFNELERMDIYADNLEAMMGNVNQKINHEALAAANNTETILVSPSGNKYILNVDDEGQLLTTSIIPKKVLFVGNSLLLGMGTYGMCASSPQKDYFYYVSEAIRNKNPKVNIEKLHGARFEQLEEAADFDEMWNVSNNIYTNLPMKESFTEDLDLILIQLGENVNCKERAVVFSQTIDTFIKRIKQRSPRARIIWIHSFFNKSISGQIIMEACCRWRIGQIDIHDLCKKEYQGITKQEYELQDGTKAAVNDLWISHPGDKGMELIAARIINYLKI